MILQLNTLSYRAGKFQLHLLLDIAVLNYIEKPCGYFFEQAKLSAVLLIKHSLKFTEVISVL